MRRALFVLWLTWITVVAASLGPSLVAVVASQWLLAQLAKAIAGLVHILTGGIFR